MRTVRASQADRPAIIQGLTRSHPPLVMTADGPALRPGRSAVQRNTEPIQMVRLRTPLVDRGRSAPKARTVRGRSAPKARTVRASMTSQFFKHAFERTFDSRNVKRC